MGLPVLFGQVEEWTLSAVLLSITGLYLIMYIYRRKRFTFRITLCDILMLLYLLYILLRLGEYPLRQECILALYTLTLLYIIVRILDVRYVNYVVPVLVFSLLFQLLDAFYHHDNTWNPIPEITGIFHNTGIFGCISGLVSVSACGLLLFSRQNKVLLSIILLFSATVLVYSQSRAAWIGAFAGIVFLSFIFLKEKYSSKMMQSSIIAVFLFSPLLLYVVKKLYSLKPVSADGHFYIWKISSQMLSESPWWGMGIDKFRSKYMYYQAAYFSENPNSPFSQIADEITVPFSEPLKVAIEQGVIGLVIPTAIFVTVLISALKKRRLKEEYIYRETIYIYAAILITLLLFSCFSYPFTYIQFLFLLIICTAVLSASQSYVKFVVRPDKAWLLLLIPCTIVACYVSSKGINYAKYLKKMQIHLVNLDTNKPDVTLQAFSDMEPVLKTNYNFLVSYANLLSLNNEYEKSIEKFTASLSLFPSLLYLS